jgi:hypothetical protein
MIIDTYVYFVSYSYGTDNDISCRVIDCDRLIQSGDDVMYLIKETMEISKNQFVFLINFQLLDSYNKEEREKE